MLLLGRWQLARAAEKISLMQGAEQASLAEAVELSTLQLPVVGGHEGGGANPASDTAGASFQRAEPGSFRRVLARGSLLSEQQFLWDNRIHKGVAGFEVLVPLQLEGEGEPVILINRGWVQPGASRSELPDVGLPEGVAAGGEVIVEGLHTLPSRGFASGDAVSHVSGETRQWPALLQYPDYSQVSNTLRHPVIMGIVQKPTITANSSSGRSESLPGLLYANNWSPVANGPEKHYGYAFQWFAMFVALTVIFLVTNSRRIQA